MQLTHFRRDILLLGQTSLAPRSLPLSAQVRDQAQRPEWRVGERINRSTLSHKKSLCVWPTLVHRKDVCKSYNLTRQSFDYCFEEDDRTARNEQACLLSQDNTPSDGLPARLRISGVSTSTETGEMDPEELTPTGGEEWERGREFSAI